MIPRMISITRSDDAPFTSHVFTSAGKSGMYGPNLTQCIAAYSNTGWVNDPAKFSMPRDGYQTWTVPETGNYRIMAVGAAGSSITQINGGGKAASMRGDFYLTKGTKLTIVVGQTTNTLWAGGDIQARPGGGGSFVFKSATTFNTSTCILAAGGGGGVKNIIYPDVSNASLTISGKNSHSSNGIYGSGGQNGLGGKGGNNSGGDGGAGISSNGGFPQTKSNTEVLAACSIYTTAIGGRTGYPVQGGFGGGGGMYGGGGGGGGYSGGGGGMWAGTIPPEGGGGGSYNSGSNQANYILTNLSNALVFIEKI